MPPGKKYKILFVTSEVYPFIKTGGLADVSSALPQKLQEMGHLVRIVVPKYGAIDERKFKIHEVVRLKDLTMKIGIKDVVFSLRSSFLIGPKTRVQIYFLDNPEYFGSRHSMYSDPLTNEDYPDNDERFILLARSVYELVQKLGWVPDIIHCNDWQCGLVPVYLKAMFKNDPAFKGIKTLFTIHNLGFQGVFPKSTFEKTSLPRELNSEKGILHKGSVNYLKSGLLYSDMINTVSETYAKEICSSKEIGLGMEDILSKRKKDLYGIVNGIDDTVWHPEVDTKIAHKFSAKNLEHKLENKKALADNFNFEFKADVPVLGMITRLYDNKGMDILEKAFPELMKMDIQLVLLGTGEKKYNKFLMNMASKYHNKFSCFIGFDDELAHLIEAGSDMFLMPSKFEPCGLNQMYSLVYGTVPIVRKTGGLADTVQKFNPKTKTGNGFVFEKYNVKDFLAEIKTAIKVYSSDPEVWKTIQLNGMKSDFSWLNSTKKYVDLYKKLAD
ncbi:MAG: starch synthase [Stygiobacter sp. RIFOXYC12_FULL_38_8]|nr:MAG: starch synthase [Stygiobacter sp. GWC2_38_9]OGV06104.1 MAG: starch synthase [Stygiobacter sp. RIFOXYB2_FULL_37_11]OGV16831.1 MAG: starch synthase [Stygiobacter sp. RIFOXYC2_FULL_38_25]OGV17339.1 MAG: starch synthase [Stygiobacter sp. RIFOXYA2_FULL_38_8]OGV23457.1 MAG: starch synthase [Stygiobacter sp. RIFOXYC12_FULL_38_8]OGV82818.1 MAG: starch synthase [Stygiobacter sp. GWF2_38_21]RJQ61729.1 MAG: glycogen synthase GlgA [Stygiobacter sp.]